VPRGLTKEQAAIKFQEFYSSLPGTDMKVFTDGSKLPHGMTGTGFVLYQTGKKYLQSSFSLGPNMEVFNAEAEAALPGLKAATRFHTARFATKLWVCFNNLEVAMRLLSLSTAHPSKSSKPSWLLLQPGLRGRDSLTPTAARCAYAGCPGILKSLKMKPRIRLLKRALPWSLYLP
jgi:hypothetical protein